MKAIIPKRLFSAAAIMDSVEEQLDKVALGIKADFEKTTKTWKNKPPFEIRKAAFKRTIQTTNKIYYFVSGGTRVRYATMTPDFSPKTRPNYLGSVAGRGGLMYVSKKKPRPGIKAREFDKTIVMLWRTKIRAQFKLDVK
jgi:hypothetical protein